MADLHFTYKKQDHSKRIKNSLILNIVISITFGLIVTASSDIKWGVGIALFIFLVQYYKSKQRDKSYISYISIGNDSTTIEYFDGETKKQISGQLKEFRFKKQYAFTKIKTPYLAVYKENELKIKQFETGEWIENKMDEVVDLFNNKTFLNL
jgi:hypothetical protein